MNEMVPQHMPGMQIADVIIITGEDWVLNIAVSLLGWWVPQGIHLLCIFYAPFLCHAHARN